MGKEISLIAFLDEVVSRNTQHYRKDFELDAQKLRDALNSPYMDERIFYFMSRPKTMTLRLNAAEYAHLCRQAEVTGLKKEPLVRQLIMGVNLRPRPPDAYAELLRALSAIGNNINQLAHQANARGAATGDEITEALHLVRQATRLVRERL